jgi:hypothetical protein
MKSRILLFLLFLFLVPTLSTARQYVDPRQDGCALQKRLEAMSHSQFKKLLAKAQAGDPAAQYLVGSTYQVGGPVPRDFDEAERWFVKCAEQRYRPPETGACLINAPMIKGSEHPELIPDSVAYASWFREVADAFDKEEKMPGQVQAVVGMTHLCEADQATLKEIVLTWHHLEKQVISTYNAKIEEANRERESTYLMQVRFRHAYADLALGTAKIVKASLSPEGATKFAQFIQVHKVAISMNEGVI